MNYSQEIEKHLVSVVRDLIEETNHESHPFHQTALEGGLKHKDTYKIKAKTIHLYLPDHHWKSGAQLTTTTHKGRPDKHEWRGASFDDVGKDTESLKQYLAKDKAHYDRMVKDHKEGKGEFAPDRKLPN